MLPHGLPPVQLSFLTIVYPSLTFTYLGQTALLLVNPAASTQAFWASIPKPIYWPMVVLATAAAIIASQVHTDGQTPVSGAICPPTPHLRHPYCPYRP
jgi:KUP system potassium uptake protein